MPRVTFWASEETERPRRISAACAVCLAMSGPASTSARRAARRASAVGERGMSRLRRAFAVVATGAMVF